MAKTPTEKEVEKLIAKSESQYNQKKAAQAKQGKKFVNDGQGVIPENIWKKLAGKTQ